MFLATPTISAEEIRRAEELINKAIREARNVTVKVYKEDTPEEELKEVIIFISLKIQTQSYFISHLTKCFFLFLCSCYINKINIFVVM